MYDVYRGSFITLAALGAPDNDGGFYATRDPLQYMQCPIKPRSEFPGTGLHVYPGYNTDDPPSEYSLQIRG